MTQQAKEILRKRIIQFPSDEGMQHEDIERNVIAAMDEYAALHAKDTERKLSEAMHLLAPILTWGHGVVPLGKSIPEECLRRAKAAEGLVDAIELVNRGIAHINDHVTNDVCRILNKALAEYRGGEKEGGS